MKKILLIIVLVIIVGIFTLGFLGQKLGNQEPEAVLIKVENPQLNQEIQSPFIINGEAVGYWFFEATFPIKLLDENGNIIKQTYAQAQEDWMTEKFVPFESVLFFSIPKDQQGTLVLQRDNPSGLPQNDGELRIPVTLKAAEKQTDFFEIGNLVKDNPGLKSGIWYLVYEKQGSPALYNELKFSEESLCQINSVSKSCLETSLEAGDRVQIVGWKINDRVFVKNILIQRSTEQLRKVKLYYYDANLDKDNSGNILCSKNGLVSVDREIPITNTPIQDTIKLLISGNLTSAEMAQGISTEYPLQGFSLEAASENNGVLTLTFNDPNNKTIGGSCRTGILWFQIEATAKQFSEIQQVRFEPQDIFQP
ncbi:MAG: Gmad2 immunoglobulin-like domain-containing protein [Candidatus Paceibacterota bacterium]|jgi:hypothetical protein